MKIIWKLISKSMFQVYFEFIKNLIMKCTSNSIHQEFNNEVYFKYNSNIFLKCMQKRSEKVAISKYLKFSNFSHTYFNWEVYLKQILIYVFISWLRSIIEVDFQIMYLCQTQKCTWSRLPKLKLLKFKLTSILKVYFLNWCISFQSQKYI